MGSNHITRSSSHFKTPKQIYDIEIKKQTHEFWFNSKTLIGLKWHKSQVCKKHVSRKCFVPPNSLYKAQSFERSQNRIREH